MKTISPSEVLSSEKHKSYLIYFLFFIWLANSFFVQARSIVYHHDNTDASAYYGAASIKWSGEGDIYDFNLVKEIGLKKHVTGGFNPYIYPPLWAEVLSPLSQLSFKQFRMFWLILDHIFLCLFFLLTIDLLSKNDPQNKFVIGIIALIVFSIFSPLERNLMYGQVNLFMSLLFYSAIHFSNKKKDFLAGIITGFCILIKLYPVILLFYFLLKRKKKTIVISIGSMILFFLGSVLLYNMNDWISFFTNVLPSLSTQLYPLSTGGLPSLEIPNYSFTHFLYYICLSLNLSTSPLILSVIHKVVLVSLVAYYGFAFLKNKIKLDDFVVIQILIVIILFSSSILWPYTFTLLVPGFIYCGCLLLKENLSKLDVLLIIISFFCIGLADFGPKLSLLNFRFLYLLKIGKFYGLIAYLLFFHRRMFVPKPFLANIAETKS